MMADMQTAHDQNLVYGVGRYIHTNIYIHYIKKESYKRDANNSMKKYILISNNSKAIITLYRIHNMHTHTHITNTLATSSQTFSSEDFF